MAKSLLQPEKDIDHSLGGGEKPLTERNMYRTHLSKKLKSHQAILKLIKR